MFSEQELLNLEWSTEYRKLAHLVKKDRSIYRSIALFFLILSLLLLFFFPILLLITFPLGLYSLYLYYRNKKKTLHANSFRVLHKERWYRAPTYSEKDPDYFDDSVTIHLFETGQQKKYELTASGYKNSVSNSLKKYIKVSPAIFNVFKTGDDVFFIFSPADDLLAYYYQGKNITLLKTQTLGNGETFSISISIPQDLHYPPGPGFSKI